MAERLLDRAIKFAVDAHSGSVRKGTAVPYILHPLEAAAIVGGMTCDEEALAAAVLHDVVEDTDVTLEQLRRNFGARVADLVREESENKRRGQPKAETWHVRKQETLDALRAQRDLTVKMICLGDKLANLRALYRDKERLGDKLWEMFNQRDPAQHAWYYRGIAAATEELRTYPAWQEFRALIDKVFPV